MLRKSYKLDEESRDAQWKLVDRSFRVGRKRTRDADAEGVDRWRRAERRKQKNGEESPEGVRRSVPADRVLDAVKRTWNPSYFFHRPFISFFFVRRPLRSGWRTGFIVGPSVKAETRRKRRTRQKREKREGKSAVHARKATRLARFIYCECCKLTPGRKSVLPVLRALLCISLLRASGIFLFARRVAPHFCSELRRFVSRVETSAE